MRREGANPPPELTDLICSRSAPRRVIALLCAYFDDTGTHRDSRVVGIAGMIGEMSDWSSFDAKWVAKIAQYGLSDFHATDCDNVAPEFDRLSGTERDALLRELAYMIKEDDLLPLSVAVRAESWRRVVADDPFAREFLERYRKPYFLCFEHCVRMGAHWSRAFKSASPLAIVFNEQGADAAMASEIFDAYNNSQLFGGQLSTLEFAPHRGCAPLQAVDLIAHEAYRSWCDTLYEPQRPERPAMDILSKNDDFKYYFNYGDLELTNAVRKYLDKSRAS